MIFNRSTSKPGSSWFLISMDWWLRWETTCSSSIINSTEIKTKKTSSNKIDNRLIKIFVLLRNFILLYNSSSCEPGDINNRSLIEKIISNDCVQLKSGLRSSIHFEMIPELLWIFLSKYYRCNGSIVCRKVTYRRKLNKPELDLYPVS